jgi:hypothetical protein
MVRKLAFVLVGLVALSLGLGACSSAESTREPADAVSPPEPPRTETVDPVEEAGPPTDAVSQLIQQALRSDGSISYNGLVRQLGAPRRVETETVANQYVDGQIDTLRTLVYTGVRALVYDVTDDPKTFLVRLSLTSTQYVTPEGVRVGLDAAQVRDKLGPPTRRNASRGEWIYQESAPKPTSMVVRVRDGRVVRIDWEFFFA